MIKGDSRDHVHMSRLSFSTPLPPYDESPRLIAATMAAVMHHDSDDDFGYNFSPEDEAALLQLITPPSTIPVPMNHIRHVAPLAPERVYTPMPGQLPADSQPHILLSSDEDVGYPDCASAMLQ